LKTLLKLRRLIAHSQNKAIYAEAVQATAMTHMRDVHPRRKEQQDVCQASFCSQNAFVSSSSMRITQMYVRNRTE